MDGSTKGAAEPVGGSVKGSSFEGGLELLSDEVPSVEASESISWGPALPSWR